MRLPVAPLLLVGLLLAGCLGDEGAIGAGRPVLDDFRQCKTISPCTDGATQVSYRDGAPSGWVCVHQGPEPGMRWYRDAQSNPLPFGPPTVGGRLGVEFEFVSKAGTANFGVLAVQEGNGQEHYLSFSPSPPEAGRSNTMRDARHTRFIQLPDMVTGPVTFRLEVDGIRTQNASENLAGAAVFHWWHQLFTTGEPQNFPTTVIESTAGTLYFDRIEGDAANGFSMTDTIFDGLDFHIEFEHDRPLLAAGGPISVDFAGC